MIRAALAAALIAAALPAQADTFGVHLFSRHEASTREATNPDGSTTDVPYQNRNFGLYYIADSGFTAGAYRNSYFEDTVYAGWTWHGPAFGPLRPSVTAVLATGYKVVHGVGALRPMVMPSVSVATPLGFSVRYFIGPAKGGIFQHVSIERGF